MSLARVKVWGSETLTASDLNNEFNNILNNALSLISPLTGSLDCDGYAVTLDAAGVTTVQSTAALAWTFSPGAKTGTPSTTGAVTNWAANTYTDSGTAGSGTATAFVAHAFQRPTLAATNSSVTTTDAAVVYIANNVSAGTNETLTATWALWVDAGDVRLDGAIATVDSRTNSVATPLTVKSVTTGTPAAGIGTGVIFQAESQDEDPSSFGQLEFAATDVNSGSEDTYFQVLLRVAGAALTACYRFAATGANKAIFTHANTGDRTYTLVDASGSLTPLTSGTYTATTSGTTIDFTSIPSWVTRITISLNGVSTNGTSEILIQIGDSGGIETGTYASTRIILSAAVNATTGFIVGGNAATDTRSGIGILTLASSASNIWVWHYVGKTATGNVSAAGGDHDGLDSALTQIRLTTINGTDAFDAGAINIMYE